MNLNLPVVRTTVEPVWATQLNAAVTLVDSHDHTTDNGQRLTTASINIDTNLSLGNNKLINVSGLSVKNRTTDCCDNAYYIKDGDFYFRDGSSNAVKITNGGTVNISSFGSIYGDYSSTGAAVTYEEDTKSYRLENSDQNPATIRTKAVDCDDVTASSLSCFTLDAQDTIAINQATFTGASTMSSDLTVSGNTTGRGIIPIGGVIAIATDITGVTVPDSFVLLDGSTISDVTSPMNGVTVPNVNNSKFLMGNATAGQTGGFNSYTLNNNTASHVHDLAHSHSSTHALGGTTARSSSTHTHNFAHTHGWATNPHDATFYRLHSRTSSNSASTSADGGEAVILSTKTSSNWGSAGSTISTSNLIYWQYGLLTYYTTGALSAPSGSGSSAVTAAASASITTTLSGAVTSYSGTSGTVGEVTPDAVDNRPAYMTTQYAMRYK